MYFYDYSDKKEDMQLTSQKLLDNTETRGNVVKETQDCVINQGLDIVMMMNMVMKRFSMITMMMTVMKMW